MKLHIQQCGASTLKRCHSITSWCVQHSLALSSKTKLLNFLVDLLKRVSSAQTKHCSRATSHWDSSSCHSSPIHRSTNHSCSRHLHTIGNTVHILIRRMRHHNRIRDWRRLMYHSSDLRSRILNLNLRSWILWLRVCRSRLGRVCNLRLLRSWLLSLIHI